MEEAYGDLLWPHDPVIGKRLIETGAFSEPRPPVIVTSGTSLTPIFINAEKAGGDPNISKFLSEHETDGPAIAAHAIDLMYQDEGFYEIIGRLSEKAFCLFEKSEHRGKRRAVSGGMRRDLIFSAPVANMLGVPHITLYKQEVGHPRERDRAETIHVDGEVTSVLQGGFYVVHVADLLTKGSSVADTDEMSGRRVGWAPMLRDLDCIIEHVIAVVDRQQGAGENLGRDGLLAHAAVVIDREFLSRNAKDGETAAAYVENERGWTESYLQKNGIDVLVPYFKPGNPKLDRGIKFLGEYDGFLKKEGLDEGLEMAVKDRYEKPLREIVNRR